MSYLIGVVDQKIDIFRELTKVEPNAIVICRMDGVALQQEVGGVKQVENAKVYPMTMEMAKIYRGCRIITSNDIEPGVIWVGYLDQRNLNEMEMAVK